MTPLDCDELVELVTDYLDGTLDLATSARFDLHLADCDGCANYLQQFRSTVRTVGRVGADDLDPDFRDRLLATFRDFRR
ncbi:anti-sigma factor family protein [Mycolicibacterium sp. CBM1]